jgi:O-antigen ligase
MGLASIEKSRVLGPQNQPNDFGAFLVYGLGPFVGLFLLTFTRMRSWSLLPVFGAAAKVLLATFSRGAYLGLGMASVVATYVRGKRYVVLGAFLGLIVLVSLPQLIPSSLVDRMAQTQVEGMSGSRLDASSENRMVLWDAAVTMTLESPVFGKGFKNFRRLKSQYTEYDVMESDTHNMFLFISSQMGIPALIVFLILIYRIYAHGRTLAHEHADLWARAIGIGGAAMAGGIVAINMFGSRMVNIEVCGYVWIWLAVMLHILKENEPVEEESTHTATMYSVTAKVKRD